MDGARDGKDRGGRHGWGGGARSRAGRGRWLAVAWAAVACAVVAGCDSARPLPVDEPDAGAGDAEVPACRACHGSSENPAPPQALNGQTATSYKGVGAHQIHLRAGPNHAPVACDSCHVVPAGVYVPGHLDAPDGRATVTFAGTALANGATPTYDAQLGSCATTWCHGSGLQAPGKHSTPLWTLVDGSQRACDSCHGAPPPAPHPKSDACEQCHADTAGPGMKIAFPAKHVDGKVDVVFGKDLACNTCHGAPPAAPHPPATACHTCHAASVDAAKNLLPGHRNGQVEVQLTSDVACNACHGAPPATPNHPAASNCSACHAATVNASLQLVANGPHRDGKVDFSLGAETCGTCHGAPPAPEKHPQMKACQTCHQSTVQAPGVLQAGGPHRDGKVDVALPTACDACHGKNGSGAPPPDHNGQTDPTLPTVGAHAAHLDGKNYSNGGMSCDACHVLPASVDAPGHLLGLLQTVLFPKGLASFKGAAPAYDAKTQTCSGVYCHGGTMDAPKVPVPNWTSTTLACDACHGVPPPPTSGHPPTDAALGTQACAQCHKLTVKPDGTLDLEGGHHANGLVNP